MNDKHHTSNNNGFAMIFLKKIELSRMKVAEWQSRLFFHQSFHRQSLLSVFIN